ncbi:G-protein coupled receptor GRL101, partial [Stylophora pistillata]
MPTRRLNDNDLKGINGSTFKRMEELEELWLQDNNITELPPELFQDLENLQELDLSNNELGNLPSRIFRNITAVEFLKLDYNKIERLHEDQFQGLVKLMELYLSENKIEALPDKIFMGVGNLKALDIFGNKIQNISSTTFTYAQELRFFYSHYNEMRELPAGFFSIMKFLITATVDTNLMCCHLRKETADCDYAYVDMSSFSSCETMFRNRAPRICLWVFGIMSLLGAVFVIVWRLVFKETKKKNKIQSIMLIHLAGSDGLMGVYLIIIGVMDAIWAGQFFLHDYYWRSSLSCQITGAIAVLSSEVSV